MKRLLTLEETAEQTGYTVKAIRNLIFSGRFPYLKIGGRIKIDSSQLSRFLEISQKVTAEEAAERGEAA